MNPTLLFFISILFTIMYSIVECQHDYNVILNDKGYSSYSRRWHRWGILQNAFTFIPMFALLFVTNSRLSYPLMILIIALFWQAHDSMLGWRLHKQLFYLGNYDIDKWLKRVFWNGRNLFIIRGMIILCCVMDYFRNT